jgi:hypothetical protein
VPPVTVAVAEPFVPPKHDTFTWLPAPLTLAFKPALGCVIVTETVVLQLFASLTVAVYVPAAKFVAVAVY